MVFVEWREKVVRTKVRHLLIWARARDWYSIFSTRNSSVNLFSVELGIPHKTRDKKSIHDKRTPTSAINGRGSVVSPALGAAVAPAVAAED